MPRKPKPWFRFYVEAVHDRKLRRLKPEVRWLFVVCLAAARQSPEPGWLLVGNDDPMDHHDLADFAHMTLKAVESGMVKLTDMGVVSFDIDRECWHVPNWGDRQYESDTSTSRVKKHREKKEETTLERSNGVPCNDEGPFMERSPSVTETESQRNFVPSESDSPSSTHTLTRYAAHLECVS